MWPAGRWRLAPLPVGRVRVKVAGLAVIAAVPIAILAGVVVEETFAGATQSARRSVDLIETGSIARFQDTIEARRGLLAGIERALPAGAASCGAALDAELARDPGRWTGLVVYEGGGAALCATAAAISPLALALAPLGADRRPGVFSIVQVGPDQWAAAISRGDGSTLAAWLPPGWLAGLTAGSANDAATWLLDQRGDIVMVGGPAARSVPTVATVSALLHGGRAAVMARSVAGTRFAYAATALPNGWRLIQSYAAEREYRQASLAVVWRLAALAVLLMTGLAAIVVAAGITFGEPLQRLSAAVVAWKAGGAFEPGPLGDAPWEVRELAHSFAEATSTLRQRGRDLVQAKERQDLLVLEIHHRVKNNLQIVASLLNLQASRIRVPEARAEFQAARDRVRALATLHRHLYSDGELHTINMRSFLVELCGQLFQAMGETAGDRIVLAIEAPELRMSADQAVPLALIVTEAVTNSVKYAFPAGRRGHISVRLTEAAGELDLVIEDDGVGIPDGLAVTEAGTRDGLGRQLIRGFARQLGASLDVKEGQGTRYAVRLWLKQPGPPTVSEPLDAA